MNRNYPLFLFVFVSVALFVFQQCNRSPSQSAQATRVVRPSTPPPSSIQDTTSPASSETLRVIAPNEGVIWLFANTTQLKEKLLDCSVRPVPSKSEMVSTARYWRETIDGTLEVLTPRQARISDTMTAHLNTAACLYHPGIEASDPVTKRRFDHRNFPRSPSTENFALDIFFKLDVEDGLAQSLGMSRLGHPEILIQSDAELPQDILWRVITLSLSGQPVEQLLKLDPLSLQIKSRTQSLLTIVATKRRIEGSSTVLETVKPSPRPPARKTPRRSIPTSSPTITKPIPMPEYR